MTFLFLEIVPILSYEFIKPAIYANTFAGFKRFATSALNDYMAYRFNIIRQKIDEFHYIESLGLFIADI